MSELHPSSLSNSDVKTGVRESGGHITKTHGDDAESDLSRVFLGNSDYSGDPSFPPLAFLLLETVYSKELPHHVTWMTGAHAPLLTSDEVWHRPPESPTHGQFVGLPVPADQQEQKIWDELSTELLSLPPPEPWAGLP